MDSELLETVIGIPPAGWELGHVTVTMRGGERQPIEAMRRGAFAVHEIETSYGRKWRLTHAPTGLQIWSFYDADKTFELAHKIEPLADWSTIRKMMPPGTELCAKVRAVVEEIDTRFVRENVSTGNAEAPQR